MGHHQAHPADHARHGHAGGGDQCGGQEQHQPHQMGVHPQGPGFLLPQAQQVQLPAEQKQGDEAQNHGEEGQGDVGKPGPGQAPHEPVGDLGQLVAGVGHQLDVGGAGVEEGGEHDARQDQVDEPCPRRPLGHQHHEAHGEKAEAEGAEGNHPAGRSEKDGQRGSEGGAAGSPQDVRGGHGVVEHPLKGGPRPGQGAAYETGHDDPGQADVYDHRFHLRGPGPF